MGAGRQGRRSERRPGTSDEPVVAEGAGAGEDLAALKVAELRQRLDAAGVTYPPKSKKADLVALLRSGVGGGAVDERADAAPQASLEAEPVRGKRVARPSSANAPERAKRTRASTRKR